MQPVDGQQQDVADRRVCTGDGGVDADRGPEHAHPDGGGSGE